MVPYGRQTLILGNHSHKIMCEVVGEGREVLLSGPGEGEGVSLRRTRRGRLSRCLRSRHSFFNFEDGRGGDVVLLGVVGFRRVVAEAPEPNNIEAQICASVWLDSGVSVPKRPNPATPKGHICTLGFRPVFIRSLNYRFDQK